MNLFISLKNKISKNDNYFFLIIFFVSAATKSIIAYFYGDTSLQNEWAQLLSNLYNYNSFSVLRFEDLSVPNLWMPPVYGYFIYIQSLIFGLNENLVISVIISQIILSSITPIIFFKILSNFFDKNLSLIGTVILIFFPLVVYASSQISSVSLYLFLLTLFLFLVVDLSKNQTKFRIILIGAVAGVLILTRRDFVLIYLLSLVYLLIFFNIHYQKIIKIIMVSAIIVSPYLIRNYLAFDKVIIHSGLGYNVWKAYNPEAKVEGYYVESKKLKEKLKNVNKDIFYRINEDKIYLQQAKEYISKDPKKYLNLFFKRVFSYYFIDLNSSQKNYYNFFHIYPNLILSILSIFGLFVCKKKDRKFNYLVLTMISFVFIYSLFALLPRYKIYILPFQILLSLSFLEYFLHKLRIKN